MTLVDHGLAARVVERALRYGGDDTRTARRGGRGGSVRRVAADRARWRLGRLSLART